MPFPSTMVRDTYDFNLNFNPASLGLLFTFTPSRELRRHPPDN